MLGAAGSADHRSELVVAGRVRDGHGVRLLVHAVRFVRLDVRNDPLPKEQQRGLVQPYIAVMQAFALTLMLAHNTLSTKALLDLTLVLPALAAGAVLGIVMFRRVSDAGFRGVTLGVLAVAGVMLVV